PRVVERFARGAERDDGEQNRQPRSGRAPHPVRPGLHADLNRSMPSAFSTYRSYTVSDVACRTLCRKYFSNAIFARCTHLPFFDHVTLRGGICGMATNAIPVSPMSARQIAFQVAVAVGCSPPSSAAMLRTIAATIDSII